jgi:pimeloyl-ACP methyl ester carboxylesterase
MRIRIQKGESTVGVPISTASYRLPIQRDQKYGQVMKMIHPSWNQVEGNGAERLSESPKLDVREQHFRIGVDNGLNIFLRYLGPAATSGASKIVLYVHGATFPSALSIAHRFDGFSWRDALNAAGFHVWGLDLLGYGESDRYPEMAQSPENMPALGRADPASRQIEKAAEFMAEYHGGGRISIIAHSWGSMATGLFAGRHPELVDRLVFFAPIAQRPKQSEAQRFPAWRLVSLEEQWQRFTEDVPTGESAVLSEHHFEEWGPVYLDSDPQSRTRSPASVKVPSGPVQEIAEGFAGQLAYDPASITVPVAIIRGEWDRLVTDADARWLFDALKNAPMKRDVKISRGTHLMHLERSRYALYREAQTFLDAGDQPSRASGQTRSSP